jgi:hypothetical protein
MTGRKHPITGLGNCNPGRLFVPAVFGVLQRGKLATPDIFPDAEPLFQFTAARYWATLMGTWDGVRSYREAFFPGRPLNQRSGRCHSAGAPSARGWTPIESPMRRSREAMVLSRFALRAASALARNGYSGFVGSKMRACASSSAMPASRIAIMRLRSSISLRICIVFRAVSPVRYDCFILADH